MKPTDQQLTVIKHARAGASILVEALAGCGKTTTLKLASASLRPGLALAFNRRAADELRQALPPTWKVATLNSIGMQALFRAGLRPQVNEDKLLHLADDIGIPDHTRRDTIATVRWARILGIVPKARGVPRISGVLPDAQESWARAQILADAPEADIELARELLARSIRAAFKDRLVDFDDQIYIPTLFLDSWPRFPTILVDEAQDLAEMNIRQLIRLGARDAQLIAVGDRNQAIYAWRGAMDDSIEQLQARFNLIRTPLTVTFRCPKAVVARWSGTLEGFEAATGNPVGEVIETTELADLHHGTAVLSHKNSILLKHALSLAEAGRPFRFVGRDFVPQIRWLHSAASGSLQVAERIMLSRIAKIETLGGYSAPLRETLEIYRLLWGITGGSGLVSRMEQILSGNTGPVFSTIYRAKGLEWVDVRLVGASELRSALSEGQNRNVLYVGETRTKNKLALVEPNE